MTKPQRPPENPSHVGRRDVASELAFAFFVVFCVGVAAAFILIAVTE